MAMISYKALFTRDTSETLGRLNLLSFISPRTRLLIDWLQLVDDNQFRCPAKNSNNGTRCVRVIVKSDVTVAALALKMIASDGSVHGSDLEHRLHILCYKHLLCSFDGHWSQSEA